MRIADVQCHSVRIPLKPEYRMISALGSHNESHFVLVRVVSDSGAQGIGEATITVRWSGETAWGTKALIDRVLRPAVQDLQIGDFHQLNRRMDDTCANNWFAKSAIEMACWDLLGKAQGKPIYELLGGACRPREIKARFSMGAYDPERAERRAAQLVEAGFDTIKVKVGGDVGKDVERVSIVRRVIGDQRAIVIDANGGWDADTAIRAIQQMSSMNISLAEQPTPVGDYAGLARVRRETGIPTMADDTCFDLAHAVELIRQDCCDVISVYPGKNGGISKSKAIADYAQQHGVACSIGSNLEWDVATAAMGHLVVATPNLKVEQYPGDILGPTYHEARVVLQPLSIEGPVTTLPDRPGLGVELDWDVIREYETHD